MYGLIGKIRTVQGAAPRLAEIMANIGTMAGCLSYVVALDPNDPDVVWVTEVWDSAGAHLASLELPSVESAIDEGRSLIVAFEERFETAPIGGPELGR